MHGDVFSHFPLFGMPYNRFKEQERRTMRYEKYKCNESAIRLYLKNGFKRVHGLYEEKFDDDFRF